MTLSTLHSWLAVLAIAADLALVAVSAVALLTRRCSRLWGDRLILMVLAATGLTALVGGGFALTSRSPSDTLHLVYGVVALLVLPIARYIGRSGSDRRRSGWLALGSVVQLAVYVRLFQTGG
jgi:hypothetical protein